MQAIQTNGPKKPTGIKIEKWHHIVPKNSTSVKNDSELRIKRINNVYLEKFSSNFNARDMRLKMSDAENSLLSTRRQKHVT
jgi:hypothetical protein